jgi:hypothetical protein
VAVMANYFLVALTSTTRSWLMNLSEGSLTYYGSCAINTQPTLRVPTLAQEMRLTSTPCSSAQGSHYSPSSSGSPRLKTPSPASLTLLFLSLFDRA